MTDNKKHISEDDFRRYRADEMSNEERNRFERLLQKHPFEAEALEGLSGFAYDEVSSDIADLKNALPAKKKKSIFRYWAAAASVLLVVASGIIILQMNHKSPIPEVAENKMEIPEKEVDRMEETGGQKGPAREKAENKKGVLLQEAQAEETSEPTAQSTEDIVVVDNLEVDKDGAVAKKSNIPVLEKEAKDSALKIPEERIVYETSDAEAQKKMTLPTAVNPAEKISAAEKTAIVEGLEISPAFVEGQADYLSGKVISADNGSVLPNVSVSAKGAGLLTLTALDGSFELEIPDSGQTFIFSLTGMEKAELSYPTDTKRIIKMYPIALQQDDAISLRASKKTGGVTRIRNRALQPLGGFEEFNRYLAEKCIIPEGYVPLKNSVKLNLKIDSLGTIDSIEVLNSPDSLLLKKAKEIIFARPAWLPEMKNGQPVDSEIKLKLDFK